MLSPGCAWNRWSSQTASARAPADCLPASTAAPACDSPPSPSSGSVQTTPAGIRSAADSPPRSSGSPTAPSSLLRPDTARQSCGSILPGSPPPPDTSVPHSNCLAPASLPGSGRRCLRAIAGFALASRLYFVQGTAQKIHLQYLLRQSL